MNGEVCIAIHDVAPTTWPQCSRLLKMLEGLGPTPLTLLIVPDYHERGRIDRAREFIAAIERRISCGDELALHGYDHRDCAPPPRTLTTWFRRRVLTASEGEFSALSAEQAHSRIASGLEIFARLRWPVAGFVPPAWLASAGTRIALRGFPLRYTSTHMQLIDLHHGRTLAAPCLTASPRSPWRRAASKRWLGMAERMTARKPLIRIGLHPADAEHGDLLECWHTLLLRLLQTRVALTKSQALQESPCVAPARC